MANQHDIKSYLIEDNKPYLFNDDNNGKILMLSGVWGSGKTYFWKDKIEKELIKDVKDKEKSYVYISLYGKDSIEELQTEIQQLSYYFSTKDENKIISSTFAVFTKVASFIPKFSFNAYGFGVEIEADKTVEKLEEENIKQQIEKGVGRLMNGGVICFDDFERKSSKIDLNDLFGFITNLTEVFKTKTIIITNQEFFQENDSELFSKIKEKSVNKFLLLNPSVYELFNSIYESKEAYSELDDYRDEILKAIKITEEKNARIFMQVLDNCLEYKESAEDKHEIFMLVIITVLFVKYNLVFRMDSDGRLVLRDEIPPSINNYMSTGNNFNKNQFITYLHSLKSDKTENFKYIKSNKDMLYQVRKYTIRNKYFENKDFIEKLNDFVESGILINKEVQSD